MGPTVATNALLERKVERTLLKIFNRPGFADALRIAYQTGPSSFVLRSTHRPARALYEASSVESMTQTARARMLSPSTSPRHVAIILPAYRAGIRWPAIVCCTANRYPKQRAASPRDWAREIGFTQISVSHLVTR